MYIYIFFFFKQQNVYLCLFVYLFFDFTFCSFFCMSVHIFVLSDQNSDLIGHMSFQKKKKKIGSPARIPKRKALVLYMTKALKQQPHVRGNLAIEHDEFMM